MRLFVIATFVLLLLAPMIASAQDTRRLPGRGEILELRSDDARCSEGFRCFIAGSGSSYRQMLDRVNRDIGDESRQVTLAQFDAANECRLIYHRSNGWMRNGSCPELNQTSARVTWSEYCSDGDCERWVIATSSARRATVYRVPAAHALTPGERAEQMARELDSSEIVETVPAPAELGEQLTELADLMEAPQPPTYAQTQGVIRGMGRALTRASEANTTPATNSRTETVQPAGTDGATPAVTGEDITENPVTQAEGTGNSDEASADESAFSPALIVSSPLLIGLLLGIGLLGYLLLGVGLLGFGYMHHKATQERVASRLRVNSLERELQTVQHDNSLRRAWNRAGMPGKPTRELVERMARSHATITKIERDATAWSPAYGDIHEHLEETLREVGSARLVKQAVRNILPGTDVDSPEAVQRTLSSELSRVRSKAEENRELRKEISRLESVERDLSNATELVRKDAARKAGRVEELERALEKLKRQVHTAVANQTPTRDLEEMLELSSAALLRHEAVLDIFDQHDAVQDDGQIKIFGKKHHEIDLMLGALYSALMNLQQDLRDLHDKAFAESTGRGIADSADPDLDGGGLSDVIPRAELERVPTVPFSKLDLEAQTVVRQGPPGKSNGKPEPSKFRATLRAPGLPPSED